MNTRMKRTAVAGVALLIAGASIAGGASVTAAAIDTPEALPADAVVKVQQIAQDDKGDWYSCEMELDSSTVVEAQVPDGQPVELQGIAVKSGAVDVSAAGVISGAIPAGELPVGGDGGSGTGVAVAVGSTGEVALGQLDPSDVTDKAIALPGPGEIRPGTTEECAALQGK